MFNGPIEDRLQIRELFDRYSDAVCRIALDDYLDCWTADAVRRGAGGECRGTEELRSHWHGIWQVLTRMVFINQIGAIEVDGDYARARSYCLEILQLRNGAMRRLVGSYEDTLRRIDGRWFFSERNYRVVVDEGQRVGTQRQSR
jgi:ketosteroid isomerase-like protein